LRLIPIVPIVLLLATLSACTGDAARGRICRSIVPALSPRDSSIAIARTAALAGGEGVRVDYVLRRSEGAGAARKEERRFLECRFAPAGEDPRRRDTLLAVRTQSGALSEVRLHLLQRFWLEREGASADPQPVALMSSAPEVPRKVAIPLQHLLFALPAIAIYALLAAAYSLIYGLVGRINLAFGELAAVGGYGAFLGFALIGGRAGVAVGLSCALLFAFTTSIAYGSAAGRMVLEPLVRRSGQQALIGTMALAIVLQEFLRLAQGSKLLWLQPVFAAPVGLARAGDFIVTVTPVALATAAGCLLVGLALLLLMRKSRFGRAWRACADDPLAAALFGVDRDRVFLKTFLLASALAGLAGYAMTVYYGSVGYAGGIALGLKSLAAAIAGGIGSVPGALIGGALLGSAESLWSALFPIELRDLAIFLLLVLLIVVRPNGLRKVADPPPH
jgi:branched-subunit amino acid ABC-type transport system permease component